MEVLCTVAGIGQCKDSGCSKQGGKCMSPKEAKCGAAGPCGADRTEDACHYAATDGFSDDQCWTGVGQEECEAWGSFATYCPVSTDRDKIEDCVCHFKDQTDPGAPIINVKPQDQIAIQLISGLVKNIGG